MSSKQPTIVFARRPKPRDPEQKLEQAKPLRITYARKPGKKYVVYRKPGSHGGY